MRVLAIDTSCSIASVAVLQDGSASAEINALVRAKFGETLLPYVAQVLKIASLTVSHLDLIAVGIGPGSFTGTRIGVATAKGLAMGCDVPLVGVVSPRAMAHALSTEGSVVVPVMDAFKGEVYVSAYRRTESPQLMEIVEPLHATAAAAGSLLRARLPTERLILCGAGLRRYEPELLSALGTPYLVASTTFDVPKASSIAWEGLLDYQQRGADNLDELEPLYVRSSDATLPAIAQSPLSR